MYQFRAKPLGMTHRTCHFEQVCSISMVGRYLQVGAYLPCEFSERESLLIFINICP